MPLKECFKFLGTICTVSEAVTLTTSGVVAPIVNFITASIILYAIWGTNENKS